MKRSFLFFTIILFTGSIAISCKKDDPESGFSDEIRKIVPAEVISAMRKQGMTIYEGKNPPLIEGIYLCSDNILSGSTLDYDEIGDVYADYRYQFSDQDVTTLTVKTSYKGYNSKGDVIDAATGLGSFISGDGNTFSIFAEEKGETDDGVTYTYLTVYSGEYTKDGIKNLQSASYMKEKNDPDGSLVNVGTIRVFDDKDDLSETMSSLRISTEKTLRKEGVILRAKGAVNQ